MTQTCPACQSPLRAGVRFCEKCGQKVQPASRLKGRSLVLFVAFIGAGWLLWPKGVGPVVPQPTAPPKQEPTARSPSPVTEPSPSPTDSEEVDGIVELRLDDPVTYLPLINTRYKHFLTYPDGDEGFREVVVAGHGSGRVTMIEFTHSKLYPNDPPGLWIHHYAARPDGVYRLTEKKPDLWLPSPLSLGTTWHNSAGSYEVTSFDTPLKVGGTTFQGVLAYRQQNRELDLDQTTWLAPGYGEILVRPTGGTQDVCRFIEAKPESPQNVDALVQRHGATP